VDSGLPLMGGIIGTGGELAWPKPTRPGDALRVESEVVGLTPSRSRTDRGMTIVPRLTRNQRNEVGAKAHGQIDCPASRIVNERTRPADTTPLLA
jgi:acyl dehydratase